MCGNAHFGLIPHWAKDGSIAQPFAIACLWDKWTDPETATNVFSFSMLTVNADQHPLMRQFHKPGDEKRTPVIIKPELHEHWLSVDVQTAQELMTWAHMPELSALPAPKIPLTEYSMEGIFNRCGKLNTQMSSKSGGRA